MTPQQSPYIQTLKLLAIVIAVADKEIIGEYRFVTNIEQNNVGALLTQNGVDK